MPTPIHWFPLTSQEQLQHLVDESKENPVVIFKHSTSCSISATAKNRLERQWHDTGLDNIKTYYLDLLAYRPVSNQIAEDFKVRHESPQLLLIHDGHCVYHTSHMNINAKDLRDNLPA